MSAKISSSPSPRTFTEAVTTEVLTPAVSAVAGADGALGTADDGAVPSGTAAHAGELLRGAAELTGSSTPSVAEFLSAAAERVRALAAEAAGDDGRLSSADADKLPRDLRLAFFALRGAAPAPVDDAPELSQAVLRDVCAAYGITDAASLIALALARHDDGNGYLKRSELEAAAKVLSGRAAELGVVSDVDKTVMPEEVDGVGAPPYPGVTTLYRILEHGLDGSGAAGDVHYVTGRDPGRASGLPAWMSTHGLPAGSIDTGIGTQPWIAEDEKVRDIERLFDAAPDKKFVLFGDTNHVDPGVYARIRAKYPDRVLAIVINNVKAVAPERTAGMHLVKNYAEAAAHLLADGVLDRAGARAVMEAAQIEGLLIEDAQIEALLGP